MPVMETGASNPPSGHGPGDVIELEEIASILLVDDHPPNLLALEAVLEPLGHRLVRARSGAEALKELLHADFAVILLDVQMAGMDGFETASHIKAHERTAETPLIFVTALSRDTEHIFKGYAQGAVDYLLKPIDPDILRSKVSVFVDLYMRGQKIKAQEALLRRRERARLESRSERRLRRFLEALPVPVLGVRPPSTVHFASRAWTEYTGHTAEQTTTILDPRVVHPDDLDALAAAWERAAAEGAMLSLEFRLRRRDGAYRWHVGRAVPENNDDGRVERWIFTVTDVDDRKRQEEERARLLERERIAREQAESANRAKDAFLATVSHELRSPLNVVLGWARLLRSGRVGAERIPQALETIERNALAQERLVEDLLDVSRIISGKLRLQVERVDLASLLRSTLESLRPSAQAKQVDLSLAVESGEDVVGDGTRLQQIVSNLVVNAIKFTPSGGKVTVTLARSPGGVQIRVADTGIGIRRELLPAVFEPFRQLDEGGSGQRGLGLGLAVVRQLVELHGGRVTAESAGVDRGTTFAVSLPRATLANVPQTNQGGTAVPWTPLEAASRLDGVTVLVVDDEADARALTVQVLEQQGATVVAAESTAEALDVLVRSKIDVLVSDIRMPVADGYSLIRSVRELEANDGARMPAVALTAHAYDEDNRHALAAGFEKHLAKPFEPVTLVESIAGLVRPRRVD
jgi:PAS domain S-box-containing protein